MAHWQNSVVIFAPAESVFAYVDEPLSIPDWLPGMVEVRNVIGTAAGQQYEWMYKMGGLLWRGQAIVVEHVHNKGTVHQNIGSICAVCEFTVEPHEEGASLTLEVEYSIPIPILGKLAEHIVMARNDRELDLSLQNIKDVVEAKRERRRGPGSADGRSE